MNDHYDLSRMIDEKLLFTVLQPIISVKKKTVIGIEALSRGIDEKNKDVIPPVILFKQASKNIADLIKLDRACREDALTKFKLIRKDHEGLILFINVESAILNSVGPSDHILNMVNRLGIKPHEVILEINESKTPKTDALYDFSRRYKEYGFMIALDDVGSGFSNLNRIPLLNPNIIKIDRFLVTDIDKNYYKQEVFKSLVNLSSSIGALVVAEGVETYEEAITVTELGLDMIQGYLISKPVDCKITSHEIQSTIFELTGRYKKHIRESNAFKKVFLDKIKLVASEIIEQLSGSCTDDIENLMKDIIMNKQNFECIYVLDEAGIQISDTVFHPDYRLKNNNLLFSPASKGADHSLKRYYYHLMSSQNNLYISEDYLSMATGDLCRTVSEVYRDKNNELKIVCIDFFAEKFSPCY
ncbi:MAG: EAL domain-containing protein [Clostridia bacterium]|nr:EAL domain-containing protein [Clostridia bacterium]